MNDEFYIGWEDKAPAGHAKLARRFVVTATMLAIIAALVFAKSQRLIGTATFEWGNIREFSGVLRATPYPHLVLPPESTNAAVGVAPLVAPFKFGINHEAICGFDGQAVTLRGTRIHRDGEQMLEVEPGSVTNASVVAVILGYLFRPTSSHSGTKRLKARSWTASAGWA